MAKYFKFPWAVSGDKTAIPNATQPDGTVSWEQGFGPDYALDPGGGPPAQDIPRNQYNQALYDVTTAIQVLQQQGAPDWITPSDNGGTPFSYAIFAWVRHSNLLWYSLVASNTAEPGTDAAKWQQFPPPAQFNPADVMASYDTTLPSGWLWMDGKTIGNAASGGTARANADTVNLFTALWNSVPNSALPIQDSAGAASTRGISAAADYAANKRLPLPDWRGRVGAGKDDLGGTAANRLTNSGSGVAGSTLGASGGAENVALTGNQNGAHSHSGTTDAAGRHFHAVTQIPRGGGFGPDVAIEIIEHSTPVLIGIQELDTNSAGEHQHSFTTDGSGVSQAHQNCQPTITAMYRIKL